MNIQEIEDKATAIEGESFRELIGAMAAVTKNKSLSDVERGFRIGLYNAEEFRVFLYLWRNSRPRLSDLHSDYSL